MKFCMKHICSKSYMVFQFTWLNFTLGGNERSNQGRSVFIGLCIIHNVLLDSGAVRPRGLLYCQRSCKVKGLNFNWEFIYDWLYLFLINIGHTTINSQYTVDFLQMLCGCTPTNLKILDMVFFIFRWCIRCCIWSVHGWYWP